MIVELDLTPFLCEAFVANKRLYPLINEIYKENRITCYRSAKNNKWYNHLYLSDKTLEKDIIAKKTLGLLLTIEPNQLLNIIRRGWPTIYNYVKTHNELLVNELYKEMTSNYKSIDRITNDEYNGWGYIGIITAQLLDNLRYRRRKQLNATGDY